LIIANLAGILLIVPEGIEIMQFEIVREIGACKDLLIVPEGIEILNNLG
jgi:hypothetical protein